jgi:two-component system NtrC family sensor kinase
VLGIITPIENQPSCSNAECHAHPAGQQILGVLDTNISLAKADALLATGSRQMLAYTLFAVLVIAFLSWLFVWRVVGQPIRALKAGTERLADGELGYQIQVQSHDEVGNLAQSFNGMSLQLRAANEEIVAWAKTLEDRVDQKTQELKRAHDHVLHVEKMATVGKMAAVVAHEINNPLSGILTYAKLLRKWLDHGEGMGDKRKDAIECLELIAGESRRCGELVKNLLTFSRTPPINLQTTDLNSIVDRSVRLVQHQCELNGIQLQVEPSHEIPIVRCDPSQIEQVLLALMMNAIDAMPRGGNLWVRTGLADSCEEVTIIVRDDGVGIPADILPNIFEPFLTTKEMGVGLGLAISHGIIERHNGRIEVASELGKGTTFTITLPIEAGMELAATGTTPFATKTAR